ncbi:hypothetical protein [Agitococcus lubricus]|uniref:DUF333 domain-containing protein n=1 Tax=Agitococcus lubricus TaxID=1077255 RepID=A0A2T5J112_9GAMM|nr:hypothetical protein [Agitococcus lubricus]PTQ89979.1 hypothetical protein C8N29_10417 [Agitococcus lubricus]
MSKLYVAILCCISASVMAQNLPPPIGGNNGRMGEPPPGPPKAFFEACKNKKEGDTVTLQNGQGQRVVGQCRMVWVPSQAMGGQGGQAPTGGNPPPRSGY